MDGDLDPVVMQAIEIVRRRYSSVGLHTVLPRDVTKAIYAELRRLDLERVRLTTAVDLEAAD